MDTTTKTKDIMSKINKKLGELITNKIEQYIEDGPKAFEEKPYLWVYEYNGVLEVEICEAGDNPSIGMYDFIDLITVDEWTGEVVPDERIVQDIVKEWCQKTIQK